MANTKRFADFVIGMQRYHILCLIALVFLTRFRVFYHPDDVVIAWRPPDNASVALNFYRNGFNILYPQIFWGGNGPGYVEMEFPIVQFVTASFYTLFGVNERLGVIIPFLSGIGIVLLVYLVARRVFDPAVGLVAGVFAAISPPLATFSQMFYVDPPMIFFSVLGIYAFLEWTQSEQLRYYLLAAASVSLAILIKPTSLHLGIPLLYLCYVKHKWDLFKQPMVWLFGIMVLLPPTLWYFHAHELYREYHNTFGILSGGAMKFATVDLFLSPRFYVHTFLKMFGFHITPFATVTLLYCLAKRREHSPKLLFHVWFASVLVYILVAAKGVDTGHQYLLPVVPPAVILASLGLFALLEKVGSTGFFAHLSGRILFASGALVLLILSTVGVSELYHIHDFWGPTDQYSKGEKASGLAVGNVTKPGSLIIVVNSLMDDKTPEESMTPADIFYFADRRGWYSAFSWLNIQRIEELRTRGAHYLVASANYASEFKTRESDLYKYLCNHYLKIMDDKNGLVFDLWANPIGVELDRRLMLQKTSIAM